MFTIPLATVRLARRIMREGHGRRPRLTPWRCTDTAPHCEQGHPRGRTREEKGPNRPAHKISAKMNERGRVILSGAWTTSTCYKPREIERLGVQTPEGGESHRDYGQQRVCVSACPRSAWE
jgi:hypothetical protein